MKDEDKAKVDLARVVLDLRDSLPAHIELAQLMARVTRAKFLALVAQGFTVDQALTLCK